MAFQQAQSYLAGMSNPFEGVLESYGQGQVLRQNSDLLKAQQAEQARKIQAQQQLETLDWSNQNDIAKVVAQFPEYTKGAQDYYNNMEAKEQKAYLASSAKIMSAIDSGRVDIAVQSLRDEADIYRSQGNDAKADERSELAVDIARDPKGMRKAIAMAYAVNAPKDAAASYKSMMDADIAENESPYTINEKIANVGSTNATALKTRADAGETISEGLSTAAIGGNAGTFSLKAGMMHAQGLITDAQKSYIDERLADEDPEAVQVFLDGLAGQNVEIAKLNKPETTVVNAGDQLVAIRKNADGTVDLVGSVAKGIDPTTQYSTDAGTENSIRSTNAQIEIANQRDATTRQGQALTQYLADQRAEIESGKFTQKTMADGRVLLFNDKGEWKPVLDTNGKPMIAKPSVADKPLNESQANSLMYGKRMQTAHKILEDLESANGSWDIKGGNVLARVNPRGGSEDFKKYEQAKRNFINAILRKESGAAIGQDEFESANKQYFPQIGDTEDVIKQKAANRKQVTNSMLTNAGVKGEALVKKSSGKVETNDLF